MAEADTTGIRGVLFNIYRRISRILAPRLKYAQALYEETLWQRSQGAGYWLDLGCGHKLLSEWRFEAEKQLTDRPVLIAGLDYDHPSLIQHRTIQKRVRGDISRLPFGDAAFDLVTSNMVFEHLKDPRGQLAEIFRVLKPGGTLIFHTPNSRSYASVLPRLIPEFVKGRLIWFLQRRKEEDVFPTFYRINTREQIDELSGSAGFEVQSLRMIVSSAQLWMIPPLVVLELLLIRLLMTSWGRSFRTNIIAVLRKPGSEDLLALQKTSASIADGQRISSIFVRRSPTEA